MSTALICIYSVTAVSVLVPLILFIIWKAKSKAAFWSFIVGALTFVLFALGAEQIANYFVLADSNPVSAFIASNRIYTIIYTALAAGFIEELGRFISFKLLLCRRKDIKEGVAFGIGYAGIQMLLTVALFYVVLLLFNLGVMGFDAEISGLLKEVTASLNPVECGITLLESVSFLIFNIGASMFVFKAAKNRKCGYFWLMGLAHTAMLLFSEFCANGTLPFWALPAWELICGLAVIIDATRICKN